MTVKCVWRVKTSESDQLPNRAFWKYFFPTSLLPEKISWYWNPQYKQLKSELALKSDECFTQELN